MKTTTMFPVLKKVSLEVIRSYTLINTIILALMAIENQLQQQKAVLFYEDNYNVPRSDSHGIL